jgi:ABC-type multidrug transport system ATPase subunit
MHAIKISKLVKQYSNLVLFRELSFEVNPGELLVLTGTNGAGKSTLLNIIAGMTKAKGEIDVISPFRYVTGTASVDDFLNVEQNIKVWLDKNVDLNNILNEWEISAFKKQKASRLSLGQRKRVILGRSLANNVPLHLLDEPLMHLDIQGKACLLNNLKNKLTSGISIVLATHEPAFFEPLSPKILDLNEL